MKVNGKLIFSLLVVAAGIIFYIGWNIEYIEYEVWTDIGVYSITIILVIYGILGILLSLMESEKKD